MTSVKFRIQSPLAISTTSTPDSVPHDNLDKPRIGRREHGASSFHRCDLKRANVIHRLRARQAAKQNGGAGRCRQHRHPDYGGDKTRAIQRDNHAIPTVGGKESKQWN